MFGLVLYYGWILSFCKSIFLYQITEVFPACRFYLLIHAFEMNVGFLENLVKNSCFRNHS